MISKDKRILAIARKYESKLRREFEDCVDFAAVSPMSANVFILSPEQYDSDHGEMEGGLGKCSAVTGNIFLRDTQIISERLLVHLYIHRISRNRKDSGWCVGIQAENDSRNRNINEVITEYLCWKIVGYDKKQADTVYAYGLDLIEALVSKIQYEQLKRQFFHGSVDSFESMFGNLEEVRLDFDTLFQPAVGMGSKEELQALANARLFGKMHFMQSLEDNLYFPHSHMKNGESLLARFLDTIGEPFQMP